MTLDAETRQRMLELVYELLPECEATELKDRIERDPQLARAYAEAQQSAGLLAEAGRLRTEKISLQRPATSPAKAADSARPRPPAKTRPAAAMPWARTANWTVGAAAAALILLSLGSCLWHWHELAGITARHLRLVVVGPAKLRSGVANHYTVSTTALTGEPLPAEVRLAVFPPGGKDPLLQHKESTDQEGHLQVTIPADLKLAGGVRLEVVALRRRVREKVETRLAVEPPRYVAQLSLDRPSYQPGETVYFRSLCLSRFSLAADRRLPIRFEIRGPDRKVLSGSRLEGLTERGIGSGAFQIPRKAADGEYTLLVDSLDASFAQRQRAFSVRRPAVRKLRRKLAFSQDSYGPGDVVVADLTQRAEGKEEAASRVRVRALVDGLPVSPEPNAKKGSETGNYRIEFPLPKQISRGLAELLVDVEEEGLRETIAKEIPIKLSKVEATFCPEGGTLVAGLENRVYFAARDPRGKPVQIRGRIVDSRDNIHAIAEAVHKGMGAFSITPRAGELYRLKVASPPDIQNEPKLPEVSSECDLVLTAGVGVFEADWPLEFNIRTAKEGLPLVAAAWCRGVPVGQQWLTTRLDKGSQTGANPVSIPLAEEVGGVIRLAVFDYRTSPPERLAERLVYRRPARRLQVSLAEGAAASYSPGEKVNIRLSVTDERGRPTPATLGVRIVSDALLDPAADPATRMPAHFLLGAEASSLEDLADTDFYLRDDPEAAQALDLLLGVQGWRRGERDSSEPQSVTRGRKRGELERLVALHSPNEPPAVFDNLSRIRADYDTHLAGERLAGVQGAGSPKARLASSRGKPSTTLSSICTVGILGAVGLLLLVAMLALLNIASGLRVWLPALAAAGVCLIVGVILWNPQGLRAGRDAAVAFAPFSIPPEPAQESQPPDPLLAQKEAANASQSSPQPAAPAVDAPAGADKLAAAAGAVELKAGQTPLRLPAGMAAKPRERGVAAAGKEAEDLRRGRGAAAEAVAHEGLKRSSRLRAKGQAAPLDGFKQDAKSFGLPYFAFGRHLQKLAGGAKGDSAEILLWQPMLVAGPDGQARIEFALPDSASNFRVLVDAHAGGGRIGSGAGEVVLQGHVSPPSKPAAAGRATPD